MLHEDTITAKIVDILETMRRAWNVEPQNTQTFLIESQRPDFTVIALSLTLPINLPSRWQRMIDSSEGSYGSYEILHSDLLTEDWSTSMNSQELCFNV